MPAAMVILSTTNDGDTSPTRPEVSLPSPAPAAVPAPSPAERVYSVPRRFDLATILTVTLAYSLLFGLLNYLTAHWIVYAFLGLLTVVVAAAQAWVESPQRVRHASMFAGAVYTACWGVGISLVTAAAGSPYLRIDFPLLVSSAFGGGVVGMLLGYLAGAVDGGVFLLADLVRNHWLGIPTDDSSEEPATEHPPSPLQ